MIAFALWEEFSKLPHVTLLYYPSQFCEEIPESDFALIHDYFDYGIYTRLEYVRCKTRYKIMTVMEFGNDSPLVDHSFSFIQLPWQSVDYVPLPCFRRLIEAHTAPKLAHSILLDHQWLSHTDKSLTDRSRLFYEWMEPLKVSHTFAQLRRSNCEWMEPPPWMRSIPEIGYPAYLDETAGYETFILTHHGSYEHSVIDMVARGTRVLVPFIGRPFCQPSMIENLNLSTFSNQEELLALLQNLPAPSPTDKFTDMPEVVARIDAYCQGVMP